MTQSLMRRLGVPLALAVISLLVLAALCLANSVSAQTVTFFETGEEFAGPFPSWKNVKADYGAKGDGVTDDTAAIEAAMRDLRDVPANAWVTLYFPPLCRLGWVTGDGNRQVELQFGADQIDDRLEVEERTEAPRLAFGGLDDAVHRLGSGVGQTGRWEVEGSRRRCFRHGSGKMFPYTLPTECESKWCRNVRQHGEHKHAPNARRYEFISHFGPVFSAAPVRYRVTHSGNCEPQGWSDVARSPQHRGYARSPLP